MATTNFLLSLWVSFQQFWRIIVESMTNYMMNTWQDMLDDKRDDLLWGSLVFVCGFLLIYVLLVFRFRTAEEWLEERLEEWRIKALKKALKNFGVDRAAIEEIILLRPQPREIGIYRRGPKFYVGRESDWWDNILAQGQTYEMVSFAELRLIFRSLARVEPLITDLTIVETGVLLGMTTRMDQIFEAARPILPQLLEVTFPIAALAYPDITKTIMERLPRELSGLNLAHFDSFERPRQLHFNFGAIVRSFPNLRKFSLCIGDNDFIRDGDTWERIWASNRAMTVIDSNNLLAVVQMPSLEALCFDTVRLSDQAIWDRIANTIASHPSLKEVSLKGHIEWGGRLRDGHRVVWDRATMDAIQTRLHSNRETSRLCSMGPITLAVWVEEVVKARHHMAVLHYLLSDDKYPPHLYAPSAIQQLQQVGQQEEDDQWQEVTSVFAFLNNAADRANYFAS